MGQGTRSRFLQDVFGAATEVMQSWGSIQMAFNVAHAVQVAGTSFLVSAAQFRSTSVDVLAALSCLVS